MKLFSKDIDLIKRILNLVLVVWLLGAVIFSYTSLIDLVLEKENYTLKEYQTLYCKDIIDIDCDRNYKIHQQQQKRTKYYNLKTFANSVGNVIIVGAFMFLINKSEKSI